MIDIFKGKTQSLEEIMASREARADFQTDLCREYGKAVVALKLNIPGPVKDSKGIREIFACGLEAYYEVLIKEENLKPCFEKMVLADSGPEYFSVVDLDPRKLKRLLLALEDQHPLGRLMDFDVLSGEGESISRSDFDLPGRTCLVCGEPVLSCSRSRGHGLEALQNVINQMFEAYFI